MPAALRPEDRADLVSGPAGATRPARRGPVRAFWVVAGLAVALILLLASQSGGGIEVPTTTVPAAELAPSTTAAPTTIAPTTTVPPADDEVQGAGPGDGKGKGNGKGNRDDDDDD
jgi:hypothetical protein